jgi:hypothetical protein
MEPRPRRAPSSLVAALLLLAAGCGGGESSEPQRPQRDPALQTLDRLIARRASSRARGGAQTRSIEECLAAVEKTGTCFVPEDDRRTYHLRLVLDERYPREFPSWKTRLETTLACVNRLYEPASTDFAVDVLESWDPGESRHDLRTLLSRLHAEFPVSKQALVVGITVWEERKIFSLAGGEIGLSQGGACVVPSWPRIENDCTTLAHELGHLVGAVHVPGKEWVMGWAASTIFHLPAKDPTARVLQTYRFHPRNLEGILVYHRARLTSRGLALPRPCHEWMSRVDACWGFGR